MSNPRVCKHGQLARSCERCDFDMVLAERDEAVAALRKIAEIDLYGPWPSDDFPAHVLRARAVLAKIDKETT